MVLFFIFTKARPRGEQPTATPTAAAAAAAAARGATESSTLAAPRISGWTSSAAAAAPLSFACPELLASRLRGRRQAPPYLPPHPPPLPFPSLAGRQANCLHHISLSLPLSPCAVAFLASPPQASLPSLLRIREHAEACLGRQQWQQQVTTTTTITATRGRHCFPFRFYV